MKKRANSRKPSIFQTDRILSISAMVISLGTLVVIMFQTTLLSQQTNLIRREQRTSVLPYLEFDMDTPSDNWMELRIFNNGLGPARIEHTQINYGDSILNMDISTFFLTYYKKPGSYSINYIPNGTMIMAGSRITLIGSKSEAESFKQLIEDLQTEVVSFEIIYSSVYGDQWIWKSGVGVPESYKSETM